MEKKVVDILPPGTSERKKTEEFKAPEIKISLPKISFRKSLFFITLVLVMVLGFFILFNLSRAEIEIWPETDILALKTKLTIDKTMESTDPAVWIGAGTIPGKIFETEKTVFQEFLSSGRVMEEKKAEGIIRVYNNYSSLPSQTLVANTRFQPPLEKFQSPLAEGENPYFRSLEKVTIPAKDSREVRVIADASGEKYNLPPSTFSIPGLVGTPQYTFIYGKSSEPMEGGFKKEIPQVTQEDLDKAKRELSEKAKEESKTTLKNKIPSDFNFLGGLSKTEIVETSSSVKPGAELEKFIYQAKAKSQALVFTAKDIENFAREFILSQVPKEKLVHRESLRVNYSPQGLVDFSSGKASFSLNLEAKIYSDIDTVSLKKALTGKSLAETRIFLGNQPHLNQIQVKFWPFWVKNTPKDIEKIEIKLRID